MFEPGKVREVLEALSYPIIDCGKFYRTKALYRGGNNPTSLVVYKDTGFCKDFAEDKGFPLVRLVSQTLNTNDPKILAKYVSGQIHTERKKEIPKLIMPRIYDPECLKRLFPNYSFYKKRGISDSTQQKYQLGLAHEGQMLRRFVFPIYDESEQIIGFSGRSLDWKEGATFPKWKHIGQKNYWIYPFFHPNFSAAREKIDGGKEIFIVESVGDSMALTEHGIDNHLVNFGLGCSPALQTFLLEKNPKKIIIATNNDLDGENHGKIAAVKTLIKLSGVFPLSQLAIKLPTLNDIGEMHESGVDVAKWSWNEPEMSLEEIKEFIQNNKHVLNSVNVEKFLKKL